MSVNVVDNNVTVTASQDVEVANILVTNTITNEYPNTITVKSNEFAVVGDALFATTKEEVPGWMRELVSELAKGATANAYNAMTGFNYNLYNAMVALQVAENKYQQVINTRITDQEAFVQAVETLNSSVQNAQAEVVGIKQTYATKDFAMATAAQTLEASLNGGAIKSSLGQLASTMTNQYGTMAQRMDVLESTFEDQELKVEGYANATDTLETYVGLTQGAPDGTGLIAKVEVLEKQNDGVIETTTGTYDVILRAAEPDFSELVTTVEPYASWLAAEVNGGIDVRLSHIGDVYIKYQDTASGAKEYVGSYKFIRTTVDNDDIPSTDAAGFTWAVIQDQAAEMAYTAALNAYDLADGKRRVFVGLGATSTPVPPYDSGDLWLIDAERVVNGTTRKVGDILRAIESKVTGTAYEQNDWVLASSYVDAIAAEAQALEEWKTNVYDKFVRDIQSQVDSKAESYYQETTPHPEGVNVEYAKWVGDLWKKPSNNDEYIYQLVGAEYKWVKTDVPDTVYDTIDGKKSIFTGNTTPVAIAVNDIWITGDTPEGGRDAKSIYQWNGASWIKPTKYTDDTAVYSLETGLANGTTTIKLTKAYVGDELLTTYVANEIDKEVVVLSGTDNPSEEPVVEGKENDLYIQKTSVTSTSGVLVDVVNTWKHNGTVWEQIGNNDNITALADLADGKRTVYSGATVPVGAVERDLWIPSANTVVGSTTYVKGEVYQYLGGTWTAATKYTEDLNNFVTTVYNPEISSLQNQVDGQVSYYYYESATEQTPEDVSGSVNWEVAQKIEHHGDIAYDRTSKNGYWYNKATSTWELINSEINSGVIEALRKADTAQATADNVVVSFYAIEQDAAPATVTEEDKAKLWYCTNTAGGYISGTLYKYNGTAWVAVDVKPGDTLTTIITQADADNYKDSKVYVRRITGWVTETAAGVVASSKAVTDLNLQLTSPTGAVANAVSTLENTLVGNMPYDGTNPRVDAKFKYNSTININGSYYNSGFGLEVTTDPVTMLPTSEFLINAEKFKFTNSNKTVTAAPFTIDTSGTTPVIAFNGLVKFGNDQTGTLDQAISSNIESVVVGDKNINITDNLIPTTSLIIDVNNAGYQFVGDPVKGLVAGIDTFAEVQVTLDGDAGAVDEVYSPYVDEVTMPYYYRFGIKGVTTLTDKFYVTLISDTDVVSYHNVTVTLEPGMVMDANSWYIVDGIINPVGSGAGSSGRILTPALEKVATISNFNMVAGTAKVLLGWVSSCTISRMKLAKITADTFTGSVATVDYVEGKGYVVPAEVANAINTNTTTIDGSKITTGTIQAGAIAAGAITADKISTDALYGKYVYGATVEGATILGANIVGSVIKSSWLDFNDTGFLTDWQYFTSATVPPAYVNNFAKDVNGQIVVDSSGYVRLPTTGSIGDVKALRSTVYSRGHEEGPNGETVTIPAISTTAVAYDDYTTSSTFRFLKESSKISGGVLIDAYLEGGYGSYDYLTFDTYVKIGYDTYKIYVKIDDYDRWWITVDKSSSSNGVRNNNFGNVVNWSGGGNVAEVVYNDPTKPFTISAESYGDGAPTNYADISTLHVKVYMSPDTYVSHSRVSGPLVSIDPVYIFRSDNDPSFSVTCEIPGIVYKSGILILN